MVFLIIEDHLASRIGEAPQSLPKNLPHRAEIACQTIDFAGRRYRGHGRLQLVGQAQGVGQVFVQPAQRKLEGVLIYGTSYFLVSFAPIGLYNNWG